LTVIDRYLPLLKYRVEDNLLVGCGATSNDLGAISLIRCSSDERC
jgi:hypothetical protein